MTIKCVNEKLMVYKRGSITSLLLLGANHAPTSVLMQSSIVPLYVLHRVIHLDVLSWEHRSHVRIEEKMFGPFTETQQSPEEGVTLRRLRVWLKGKRKERVLQTTPTTSTPPPCPRLSFYVDSLACCIS